MNDLTYTATPGQQPAGLRHESVNVGERLIPEMDGNIDNVRHKTEARHGRVEKECEETSLVSTVVLESWWDILGGHQHHQWHVEIVR